MQVDLFKKIRTFYTQTLLKQKLILVSCIIECLLVSGAWTSFSYFYFLFLCCYMFNQTWKCSTDLILVSKRSLDGYSFLKKKKKKVSLDKMKKAATSYFFRDDFKTQTLVDRQFWPVSIVPNNDNCPEPDWTASQPVVGFWSPPHLTFFAVIKKHYSAYLKSHGHNLFLREEEQNFSFVIHL